MPQPAFCVFPGLCIPGRQGRYSWLVLEYLKLTSHGDEAALGHGLAGLHSVHGPAFGWPEDNFIGLNPQTNSWCRSWPEFFWNHRLKPQLQRASDAGHGPALGASTTAIREAALRVLDGHQPKPALLHGDLWAGNHGFLNSGEPVIFDPASYYGDRETDLAMMELFGGFGHGVYKAYQHAAPLEPGHQLRRELYQLYHLLNHLNLFGTAWLGRCATLVGRLVKP